MVTSSYGNLIFDMNELCLSFQSIYQHMINILFDSSWPLLFIEDLDSLSIWFNVEREREYEKKKYDLS